MFKIFKNLILCLTALYFITAPSSAEVVAPALQYMREDYPAAFLSKEDYHLKLNTTRRYKLRCSEEITAFVTGDPENLKAFENDEPDDEKMFYELVHPKDVIIKTKHETYTYMQIFTNTSNIITVLLSINSKNEVPPLINFGSCTMFEDVI